MSRLLGLLPHMGLPSGSLALDETKVQVPTSCSFSDFCCATASSPGSASPSQIAVVKAITSTVRGFIEIPRGASLRSDAGASEWRAWLGCTLPTGEKNILELSA